MHDGQKRFDDVLGELEQERRRFDEDLKRLTAVAAHLRSLLPKARRTRRKRCTPRHRF